MTAGRSTALRILLPLALLAGCSHGPVTKTAATRAPAAVPEYSGPPGQAAAHPFGAKWDWPRIDRYAGYLRELAGGAAFYQFSWCDIEPSRGARNWSSVDGAVRATRRLGYVPLLKLRVGSCWVNDDRAGGKRSGSTKTSSAAPNDLAAYTGLVREMVQRYTPEGVTDYALENEPNAVSLWSDDAAAYRRLVTAGAAAVRAVDPRAKVVDGGLSSTAYGVGIAEALLGAGQEQRAVSAYRTYYARRTPTRSDDFPAVTDAAGLRRALAGDQAVRNLAFLDVTAELVRTKVVDLLQIHFYESWEAVPELVDFLRRRFPQTPIEAWEVGQFRADGDDAARAGEAAKTLALLLAGGVRRAIWLPVAVNPGGRHGDEPRYGLLDPDGTVRATGRMLSALAAAARGATITPLPGSGRHGIVLRRPDSTAVLAWGESGAGLVLRRPGHVQLMTGSTSSVRAGRIHLAQAPAIVIVAGPPDDTLAMAE